MTADDDVRAPGAAVTVALCGHWEHEPPCPLAPHHTDTRRSGDEVRLRVLFAAEPDAEAEVRGRIEAALARSIFTGPDGRVTHWDVRSARSGRLRDDELPHAEQLVHH